jgi:Flp pilus assembly protein TadD
MMTEKDQLLQLAIQLTAAEQYMQAMQALRKAFRLSPSDPDVSAQLSQTRDALLDRSEQRLLHGRFAEPQKRLTAWVQQFPKDIEARILLAQIPERAKGYRANLRAMAQDRIKLKDYQGAQLLFQNWLQQFPDDTKARSDLGQVERFVAARAARTTPRETTEAEALILRTIEVSAIEVPPEASASDNAANEESHTS